MKYFIAILAIILSWNIASAQVVTKNRQQREAVEQKPQKQVPVKQRSVNGLKPLNKVKIAGPAKSPEEIARTRAYNWIAPFKNYGSSYTPETINTLKVLDLSTGSPVINGIPRTVYMCDDSLVHLKQFTGLTRLVATFGMTNKGLDYIGTLHNLTGLYLSKTNITDAGLSKIANLPMLETLVLFDTSITNAGLEQIATEHPGLRVLNIGETAINDAGLVHLQNMSLENLILTRGNFTDNAIPYILPLSNLKLISIEFTQISQAGKDQLKAAFPNATIVD